MIYTFPEYNKYTFFWETEDVFSQWHPSVFNTVAYNIENPIVVNYNCAEQYMMVNKSICAGDNDMLKLIMNTTNPAKQKEYGRKLKVNIFKWAMIKEDVVYAGNKAKFEQNPTMLQQLRDTKGTLLAEASPYDKVWGIGLSKNNPQIWNKANWKGSNLLGKVLTQLRFDLFGE